MRGAALGNRCLLRCLDLFKPRLATMGRRGGVTRSVESAALRRSSTSGRKLRQKATELAHQRHVSAFVG
jgi:hypothetical protein